MKICTSILGLGKAERETGAAVVDIEFVRHALLLGHSVQVVIPQGREACVAEFFGVRLLNGGTLSSGIWGRVYRLWFVWQQLWRVYRADPQTIFRVNSFFSSLLEIVPLLWLSKGRLRLFIQFHHKDHNRWRNRLAAWVIKQAQVVVCPSDAARSELVELLGYVPSGLLRVHHGVHEKFFVSRSSLAQITTAQITTAQITTAQITTAQITMPVPLRLLFVGHLESRKNPRFLLRLAQALQGIVDFELTIVGSGPELENLQAMCQQQAWAQYVVFAYEVSDEEKLRLYASADLFVFPSLQEGFGLVLCEAMAAGVPVLAFNTSAMPEIVLHGTGFLVAVDDVGAMVGHIQVLAADRAQLHRLSQQASQHARQHFGWAGKVAEVCRALQHVFTK